MKGRLVSHLTALGRRRQREERRKGTVKTLISDSNTKTGSVRYERPVGMRFVLPERKRN